MKKRVKIIVLIITGVLVFNIICFFGYQMMRNYQINLYKNGIRELVKEHITGDEKFERIYGKIDEVNFTENSIYEESKESFRITVGCDVQTKEKTKYSVIVIVTSLENEFVYEYDTIELIE